MPTRDLLPVVVFFSFLEIYLPVVAQRLAIGHDEVKNRQHYRSWNRTRELYYSTEILWNNFELRELKFASRSISVKV